MEAKVKVAIPSWLLRQIKEKIMERNPSISVDDILAACIIKGIPELEKMSAEEIIQVLEEAALK